MSSHKPTIKDVAKEAGVSIATVSRFLNNPARVRDDKRLKIKKAINKLNYQPAVFAQVLAGGKLNAVTVIIPGYEGIFHSFFMSQIIRGVGVALENRKIDLHIHIFTGEDNLLTSLTRGVIFVDIIGNEEQFKRVVNDNIPVVVVNRKVDNPKVSYVAIDNFSGAYEAVKYLINKGHKRIAHLAGDLRVQCAQERLQGYKQALLDNNISLNENYIKNTNFSPKIAKDALIELFDLRDPPTAIFCCSDDIAYGVMLFAAERNLTIPDDLSVVGFDDNHFLSSSHLALTTVHQPLEEMASLGAELLYNIIHNGEGVKNIILPPQLMERDTATFPKE